jgi:hypothetical protein
MRFELAFLRTDVMQAGRENSQENSYKAYTSRWSVGTGRKVYVMMKILKLLSEIILVKD